MTESVEDDSEAERRMEYRPLTSLSFVRSAAAYPHVNRFIAHVDRWSLSTGKLLTLKPIFRIALLAYVALLHVLYFACLMT